jgi:ABC-type lipoprotein release transport system permease subunit
MEMKGMTGSIVGLIIGTVIGIVLSIIYFVITLFVIKAASDIVFAENLSTDMAVLAAALVSVGSMLGGAGMRRGAIE